MSTEEEVALLKAATREAHEAIQDLTRLLKEAKEIQASLADEAKKAIENGISKIVQEGLDDYKETLARAIDDATQAVFRRFDTVADTLMGTTKTNRRRGEPSLVDIAERIKNDPSSSNS